MELDCARGPFRGIPSDRSHRSSSEGNQVLLNLYVHPRYLMIVDQND